MRVLIAIFLSAGEPCTLLPVERTRGSIMCNTDLASLHLGFNKLFSKSFLKVGQFSVRPNLIKRVGSFFAVTLIIEAA